MTDRLGPGDLAFNYGNNLHKDPAGNVSVQLITKKNAAGKYTKIQMQIIYDLDIDFVKQHDDANIDPTDLGDYQVNYNEIGFHENTELFLTNTKNKPKHRLTVNLVDSMPIITAEIPLGDEIKRDSESLMHRNKRKKVK